MTVGATPFSLYVTASPDQIQYVVGDAGAKIAVIDEQFADRFLKVKDDLPDLEHIVVVGDAPRGRCASRTSRAIPTRTSTPRRRRRRSSPTTC
jgi:long-subunit acyl-CoA synthetase (AMP-forming)